MFKNFEKCQNAGDFSINKRLVSISQSKVNRILQNKNKKQLLMRKQKQKQKTQKFKIAEEKVNVF